MRQLNLTLNERVELGKNKVKKLRKKGFIPGIIYGKGENLPVYGKFAEVFKILKESERESILINFHVNGETQKSGLGIIREIQRDPVTDQYIHFDLMEIDLAKEIEVEVKVVLIGEAKGVKYQGGILEQHLREISIRCLPTAIPDHIEVDVSELEIGDVVKVSDLKLKEGIKILENPEEVIVSVVAPEIEEEEVEEVEEVVVAEEEAKEEEKKEEEKEEEE